MCIIISISIIITEESVRFTMFTELMKTAISKITVDTALVRLLEKKCIKTELHSNYIFLYFTSIGLE